MSKQLPFDPTADPFLAGYAIALAFAQTFENMLELEPALIESEAMAGRIGTETLLVMLEAIDGVQARALACRVAGAEWRAAQLLLRSTAGEGSL